MAQKPLFKLINLMRLKTPTFVHKYSLFNPKIRIAKTKQSERKYVGRSQSLLMLKKSKVSANTHESFQGVLAYLDIEKKLIQKPHKHATGSS